MAQTPDLHVRISVSFRWRCTCCDLPVAMCGTEAIKRLREEDPEFASFVETPEGARI